MNSELLHCSVCSVLVGEGVGALVSRVTREFFDLELRHRSHFADHLFWLEGWFTAECCCRSSMYS